MPGTSLSINTIVNTVSSAAQVQQTQLTNTLSALEAKGSDGVSQLDVLKLQQKLGLTNMLYELQSTIVKAFLDSVKSIIQKSS